MPIEPFVEIYRPRKFSEVIGSKNSQIADILEHKLQDGSLSRTLLFTGETGQGKTTLALIIARATTDEPELDIIEMNMSDSTGIDAVRSLSETYAIRPAGSGNSFKTFIMDEVHNMSRQAQDCLLKLIERTPQRTRFILATDSPEKLDKAIIGRCQQYHLEKPEPEFICKRLSEIAREQKIKISPDAIKLIVSKSHNVRKAISNLESLIGGQEEITVEIVGTLISSDLDEASDFFPLVKALIWPETFKTAVHPKTNKVHPVMLWETIAPLLQKSVEKVPAQETAMNLAGYCRNRLLSLKYKTNAQGQQKDPQSAIKEFKRLHIVLDAFSRDMFMVKPENTLTSLYWKTIIRVLEDKNQ